MQKKSRMHRTVFATGRMRKKISLRFLKPVRREENTFLSTFSKQAQL